jgi:hypothetical protein
VGERPKKKKIIFSPPPSLPHSGSVDDAAGGYALTQILQLEVGERPKKKKLFFRRLPPFPIPDRSMMQGKEWRWKRREIKKKKISFPSPHLTHSHLSFSLLFIIFFFLKKKKKK